MISGNNNFTLLSKQEIAQKLGKLKLPRGQKPGEGDVLTLLQISKHLKYSNYTILMATLGEMSDSTQIRLSHFLGSWEQGRIKFMYNKKGGWKVEFPENPVPRGQSRVVLSVSLNSGSAKLQYKRED
jgi:hypothetical protein